MRKIAYLIILSASFLLSAARADVLPDVENTQIEGNLLTWDAQEGATGYNILKDYRYFDTVRGSLSYPLTQEGEYSVVAFNDSGDFGDDYGERVSFVPEEPDASITYNASYNILIAIHTCKDVGPGESCTARCPGSYQIDYGNYISTEYTKYMSGGACSTSDIVEADAFAGPNSYKCTVPTYSGEVVAQAICPFR